MDNFVIEPTRPGYTYFPPEVDDATGQVIEGTDQVVETQYAAFAKDERENGEVSSQEETIVEHSETEFDNQVALADVSQEINETVVVADDAIAEEVMMLDLPQTETANAVQYLISEVYQGNMSAEDAFNEALTSGLSHSEMLSHWNAIKTHFAYK